MENHIPNWECMKISRRLKIFIFAPKKFNPWKSVHEGTTAKPCEGNSCEPAWMIFTRQRPAIKNFPGYPALTLP